MVKLTHFALAAALAASAAPAVTPDAMNAGTVDRLDMNMMTEMVAHEMALVEQGLLAEAEVSLAARTAISPDEIATADLIESFGVQLYIQAETTQDRALMIRSLHYLDLAVEAYRHAFGKDDPEVAYALTSYADVERKLNPENPSFSADEAYSEAYRINRARYGPRAIITLAGLVRIGELRSLPSRSRGDPAKIEAARTMLLEAFNGATRGSGWNAEDVRNDADATLRKLDGPDARQRELH